MKSAAELIDALDLQRHPEGGWFRETWRAPAASEERATGTAIYYLLEAGEVSHWHRVDASELWHFYAGAPLALTLWREGGATRQELLGPDLAADQRPQRIVGPGEWQSARSLGAYTLVGCTVSPAFEFAGFELAPPGWAPPDADRTR